MCLKLFGLDTFALFVNQTNMVWSCSAKQCYVEQKSCNLPGEQEIAPFEGRKDTKMLPNGQMQSYSKPIMANTDLFLGET